tara:strand:- start:4077 stop:4991 length:915 start_codon:yes stop_codon:yes gene_type:complete
MKRKRPTSLKAVKTEEVSLVESGANRKVFQIMKNAPTMDEVLVQVLKAEGESETISKLDEDMKKMDLPEDAKTAMMAAMKLLEAYSDEMSVAEALRALRMASGEKVEKPSHYGKHEDDMKKEDEDDDMKKMDEDDMKKDDEDKLEKALREIPEGAREAFESIYKAKTELVEKAAKLERELGVEIAKRERTEYVAKAEQTLGNIPGHTLDEVVDLVLEAKARDPQLGARVEKALESSSAALQGGALLVEAGTASPMSSGGAWSRIEKSADELMKTQPGLTKSQAITKTIQTNPDLYGAYVAEKGA